MGNGPTPFADIGKKAKDLLRRDYNFDQKFTLKIASPIGMSVTATGMKKDNIFLGDLNTVYKSQNTIVDVKVDTYTSVSTKVTITDILPRMKAALSFSIPDSKSCKMGLLYLHPHAAIESRINLNLTPLLKFSATIGSKHLSLGGEVGFDFASATFTNYDVGIGLNKRGFSAALILADKGRTLKASYIHSVSPLTTVAAEMTNRAFSHKNNFTIGCSHVVDPFTLVKTRVSNNGKLGMQCQREWRPKSFISFSVEYDSRANNAAPKLGLALALKP